MSILDKFNDTIGETITFYSYKGGNGRTMALSNVATLLAQQNPKDKILVIDWDLEAPGLHRFFFQDSLFPSFKSQPIKEFYNNIEQRLGLIDLFITLEKMIFEYNVIDDTLVTQILDKINFDKFIVPTSFNNLLILKAGRFDDQYPDKVNTFNWERLFNKAPSLIRLFSEKLTKKYKYVLIDSRTGFTDISGICTMLMPQKLVVVFTPNRQSYTGIKNLIIKATTYRRKSNDIRPLLVFPLPSRIEFSRDDLRADWRYGNDEKRITGYQNMFQNIFKDVYELDECDLTEYFEQVQIQQSPNYAYGEEIAVISEKTKDSFSLSKSYEIFTQWLVDSILPWQSKRSEESSNVDTSAAVDFYTIGLEFEEKGQHEKALTYYNRSLAIYEELDHKEGLAQLHNKIGTLLKNMERLDEALKHLEKALELHKNQKDQLSVAKDYTSIAGIFEQRVKYEDALKFYDEALKAYPKFNEALEAKRILKPKLNEMSTKNNRTDEYHQIFISYAQEDSNAANHLFRDLKEFEKEFKLKLWLDKERLLPGQKWAEVIQNVIKESKYFILLLSKNAIEKNAYVQEELRLALEKADQHQAEIYILPIRLDDCQIPELFQKLNVIDLFPDWKYGFEKILRAMGMGAKPKKLTDVHWENLLDAIDRKNCIPFIGSSALEFFNQVDNDAFLTNDELAREWAEKYDYPFEDAYQLPKVAQYVAINELGNEMEAKRNISSRLRRIKPPNFLSDKFNKSPHAILAELNLPIYITTNYDFFMEEALKSQEKKPVTGLCRWNDELKNSIEEKTEQDQYRPTKDEPLVFHFHGCIDYPESLVLTERDHFEFVIYTNKESEKGMLPTFLRKALPTSTLLFIGYSLDDINFRSIFQGALSFMSTVRKRRRSIIVLKNIDTNDSVLKEKVTKYMEHYSSYMFEIIIYWGEPNEFIEELHTKWKEFNENKKLGMI